MWMVTACAGIHKPRYHWCTFPIRCYNLWVINLVCTWNCAPNWNAKHPIISSGGPIYDWINVAFKHKTTQNVTGHPCRLAVIAITPESQPYRLIVQRGLRKTGIKSVLFTEWEMVTSCLHWTLWHWRTYFVIVIKEDGSKVLQALSRHLWVSEFTEPIDKPTHIIDKVIWLSKIKINKRLLKCSVLILSSYSSVCKVNRASFCFFCPSWYPKIYPRRNPTNELLTNGVAVQWFKASWHNWSAITLFASYK